ncbi:G protein pathway suppressor 2-like isoform X2 [Lytechinus pictus]|uniref:G protein pathway suppressor 2-like isoform X2 n=1 Tax=Lytechinus pictus TaxID=7653 RepID=UPI0030B9FCBC
MPALLERPKLSKAMAAALRVHVVKERDRKRQEEEEADKAIERKKQEQERLRKKQEAETLSLEETKEQVKNLEEKLKTLHQEKHELFGQLKKVLNEDENRRRQQESKKNEMLVASISQSYHPTMQLPGPHMLVQSGSLARPTLLGDGSKGHYYRGAQTPPSQSVQNVKRSRSPSPPVVDLYPKHHIQGSHYPPHAAYTQSQVSHAHSPYRQQGHIAYTTAQAPSSAFINQSASGFPPTQQPVHANYASSSQPNPSKYQARESAFSSYGNHFATAQKGIGEQFSQSYQQQQQQQQHQQQQQQQQRYLQGAPSSSLHSASHHGVEPSRKASSEGDDQGYYQAKLQGQQHIRQLNSGHAQAIHHQGSHQPLLTQGQVPGHMQPAQTKSSIPTSFAAHGRRKPESPVYHKKPSQQHGTNYPPGQGSGRSGYGSSQGQHQGPGRYYQGH